MPPPRRAVLLAAAMLALVAGLWAGLLRLGWALPLPAGHWPAAHGPLMIGGFLGTLIGLERAVALARPWAYAGPALTAVGAALLLAGGPGALPIAAGSAVLVAVLVVLVRRHGELYLLAMGLGAVCWLVGNLFWLLGWPLYEVVVWWIAFLVLTIAGERLELARMLLLSARRRQSFVAAGGLVVAGLLASSVHLGAGSRLIGLGLVALATWLLLSDVARRTVRLGGLPRFIAINLLLGYVWLAAGGGLWARYGAVAAGPAYDAVLHALLLGFVFSMIFGHAPIVFPAVLRRPLPFRRAFYLHVALLHASLALRLIGDLAAWAPGRRWGGAVNVLAVLLFVANSAFALRSSRGVDLTSSGDSGGNQASGLYGVDP